MVAGRGKLTQTLTLPLPDGTKVRVKIVIHQAELDKLIATKESPVGKFVYKNLKRVQRNTKAIAPRSPNGTHGRPSGYLASKIGTYLSKDSVGVYGDVVTRARSKASKRKTWSYSTEINPNAKLTKAGKPRKVRHATSKAAYYGRIQEQRGRNRGYMERGLRASLK